MVVGDSDEVEDEGNVCGSGISCLDVDVELEEDIVFCCGV